MSDAPVAAIFGTCTTHNRPYAGGREESWCWECNVEPWLSRELVPLLPIGLADPRSAFCRWVETTIGSEPEDLLHLIGRMTGTHGRQRGLALEAVEEIGCPCGYYRHGAEAEDLEQEISAARECVRQIADSAAHDVCREHDHPVLWRHAARAHLDEAHRLASSDPFLAALGDVARRIGTRRLTIRLRFCSWCAAEREGDGFLGADLVEWSGDVAIRSHGMCDAHEEIVSAECRAAAEEASAR